MIPVPDSEIIEYYLDGEADANYANLIRNELLFINKHQALISKRARIIYYAKKHESTNRNSRNASWFDSVLPFAELENLSESFI